MKKTEILDTTFGDLIVAVTEEATIFVRDERDVSKVVAFALVHMFNCSDVTSRALQLWH